MVVLTATLYRSLGMTNLSLSMARDSCSSVVKFTHIGELKGINWLFRNNYADEHPCSLPVPSLWIDVLQKVKALGFNCVSFYIDWALLEGKPGEYTAEGVFALEPFFDAAKEAGIYLLARPGPYINAEVSGGGFPGWLQRVNGTLRSSDEAYLKATDK